jgi:hypothetical protein
VATSAAGTSMQFTSYGYRPPARPSALSLHCPAAVAGCAVEAVSRPAEHISRNHRCDKDFRRNRAMLIEIAQYSNTGQDRLPQYQSRCCNRGIERDAVQRTPARIAPPVRLRRTVTAQEGESVVETETRLSEIWLLPVELPQPAAIHTPVAVQRQATEMASTRGMVGGSLKSPDGCQESGRQPSRERLGCRAARDRIALCSGMFGFG